MSSELGPHSDEPEKSLQGESSARLATELEHCFIYSASNLKREMISEAVNKAGWQAIVCRDAPAAVSAIRRKRFRMAWVDVTDIGDTDNGDATEYELRDFCQSISALPDVLLAICGQEGDPSEEIWARELGVWLYLPGLSLDDAADITALCDQARMVAASNRASL